MSYVIILLHRTLVFEWYMMMLVVENEHQDDTYHNEIGVCAQTIDIMIGLIANTLARTYIMNKRL